MNRQYMEQWEGGYWITGTRISLDSVVYAFLNGHESPLQNEIWGIREQPRRWGSPRSFQPTELSHYQVTTERIPSRLCAY